MLDHSWRWFGPGDRITLKEIVQTGATGIVSALHQVAIGDIWTPAEIQERKQQIEKAGLNWYVVESIPVHEDIKRQQGNYTIYTDNYAQTIRNLGKAGIKTICYNFMPVLDWSRTNLKFRFPDGSESLYFNYAHFAAIDIYILQRTGAAESYPEDVRSEAAAFFNSLDKSFIKNLEDTFLLGFPGSGETLSLDTVKERIDSYTDIDTITYRKNLFEFLKVIVPVAEEAGVRLAIHPDDPPFPLMGLPRIVSTQEDVEEIINFIDSPFNGITFCTGSFGASTKNDLPEMAEKFASRINFAHLRNVTRDENKNFHENYFFGGDIDMYSIMKTIVVEDIKRKKTEMDYTGIPVRPDHGAQMLGDIGETNYPGYSLYGRLKSLAEIRGLEIGIRRGIEK